MTQFKDNQECECLKDFNCLCSKEYGCVHCKVNQAWPDDKPLFSATHPGNPVITWPDELQKHAEFVFALISAARQEDKERLLEDVLKKINWGCKLESKDGEVCGLCFYDEYANSIQNQLIQLKG